MTKTTEVFGRVGGAEEFFGTTTKNEVHGESRIHFEGNQADSQPEMRGECHRRGAAPASQDAAPLSARPGAVHAVGAADDDGGCNGDGDGTTGKEFAERELSRRRAVRIGAELARRYALRADRSGASASNHNEATTTRQPGNEATRQRVDLEKTAPLVILGQGEYRREIMPEALLAQRGSKATGQQGNPSANLPPHGGTSPPGAERVESDRRARPLLIERFHSRAVQGHAPNGSGAKVSALRTILSAPTKWFWGWVRRHIVERVSW